MRRSEIREQIFQLLFRAEFNRPEEMGKQAEFFFREDSRADEKEMEYITAKLEQILSRLEELDGLLNEHTVQWDTSRMGKVDLTILRLALYEIKFDGEIPDSVAINEAVELAKKFGQDNSSAFVNGVLSKLMKHVE